MTDVYHMMGDDLAWDASGDLLVVDGSAETDQRVLRRLLTPPGDYLFDLAFGAGLPSLVGEPESDAAIRNLVLAQIFNEPSVAQAPEPTVTVDHSVPGEPIATIVYTDAITGQRRTLVRQLGA